MIEVFFCLLFFLKKKYESGCNCKNVCHVQTCNVYKRRCTIYVQVIYRINLKLVYTEVSLTRPSSEATKGGLSG